MNDIVNNIFSVKPESFTQVALGLFKYQYQNNEIYKCWVDSLNINVNQVSTLSEIPFLPIQFFKSHKVVTTAFTPEVIFTSSGTGLQETSKHFVKDEAIYTQSFSQAFQHFYGDVKEYCVIGLLPSYLERNGSSLITMVDYLIRNSNHELSGFYLNNFEELHKVLLRLQQLKQKVLLMGVTFALLDFAEQFPMKLSNTIVMETGGMKGRRREMVREEVHEILKAGFGVSAIHSEYGMTELLSQAYSKGNGIFETPPWMKILIREDDDPLQINDNARGLINVIDLANIYSCSFIASDDVGIANTSNFEVIGRMDNSDVRGCNLMVY